MKLHGTEAEVEYQLRAKFPDAPMPRHVKCQLMTYQMIALYGLATQYNSAGARILEIGTGQGGSAFMLSKAAPKASIVSLTVNPAELRIARQLWHRNCSNVLGRLTASWAFLDEDRRDDWSMIFVDGDHNNILLDMPWFNRLEVGGLFFCHDYSPAESSRPSPVVYNTINQAALALGRELDVLVMDHTRTGMAGLYRQEGEQLAVA